MTNRSGTLYTGVSSDLTRRVYEHANGVTGGFTSRYRIGRLVYFEQTEDIRAAITREKQIKGWVRAKKLALVRQMNPTWKDLTEDWNR